jgi:hypothetical protein
LTQIKGKNRDHSGHFAAQSGCPLERKSEELIGSCLKSNQGAITWLKSERQKRVRSNASEQRKKES